MISVLRKNVWTLVAGGVLLALLLAACAPAATPAAAPATKAPLPPTKAAPPATKAPVATKAAAPKPAGTGEGLPFALDGLKTAMVDGALAYLPPNTYNIFINYELGMHCVGFDINYCCVIPPYNSVQAQAVQVASADNALPKMLSPDDGVKLRYGIRDNTYSEGNKMAYWGVPADVNGDGDRTDPNDNMANYVWTHLYIYQDLEGTIPDGATAADRLHVGKEIPVQIDHGPSGAALQGFATYVGEGGGDIVFTESRYGAIPNIPLKLTTSYVWDALGLPLTAFNDSKFVDKGHRGIGESDFQPYQYSEVTLYDANTDQPVEVNGQPVKFFGTNPVDIPNCEACHASDKANGNNPTNHYKEEYDYWMTTYPDMNEYMARLAAGAISVLELHDARFGTDFLSDYNPKASYNRLGKKQAVNCSDCHGDNVQGRLKANESQEQKATPLTIGIHKIHLGAVPYPDKFGRPQNCQMCHPTHYQDPAQNKTGEGYSPITLDGEARFSDGDIRESGGGCYLRRDAHANRDAKPPFFLNDVGKWLWQNVSQVDGDVRGLYCTNCHNEDAHALYNADKLDSAQTQEGETLRNKSVAEIAKALGMSEADYTATFLDPTVGAKGNPLLSYYANHKPAALPEVGDGVTYADASAGEDWWLAAGEPHCADCHVAPFVESLGGTYFPIDQAGKYSLYRYSKAHANLACQSCHESIHGLYATGTKENGGPDQTTYEQALQFSPDGKYAGPVTCVACHAVNANGVPVQLTGTSYADDYYASVTLMHSMRGDDFSQSVDDLVQKYPYDAAKKLVADAAQ